MSPYPKIIKKYSELYTKLFKSQPLTSCLSKYILQANPVVFQFISQIDHPEELSKFIEIPLTKNKETYINLLYELFSINFGKVPYLENMLLWFPDYLLKLHQVYQSIMFGEGPLPIHWRFYLGIMAVSCYSCDYLLNRLMTNFIKTGGDVKWLESGLSQCPRKLQKLAEINLIMAHSPWKLKHARFFIVNLFIYEIEVKNHRKMKRGSSIGQKMRWFK